LASVESVERRRQIGRVVGHRLSLPAFPYRTSLDSALQGSMSLVRLLRTGLPSGVAHAWPSDRRDREQILNVDPNAAGRG
jgi:hypothetical protein